MPKYRTIVKRVITPEEYYKRTGIDLSHTDTSRLRCLEVDERVVSSNRRTILQCLLRSLHRKSGSISIEPA